jgi:ABC-2 type transport system permease protein
MWERIRVITIKEFHQALREPRMRLVLLVPPVLQLILFGFAVNLDVSSAHLAWMDLDQTSASTDLRAAFDASPTFVVSRVIANEQEVKEVLDRGEVMAVVRVLPGFGKEVKRGQQRPCRCWRNQLECRISGRCLRQSDCRTLRGERSRSNTSGWSR